MEGAADFFSALTLRDIVVVAVVALTIYFVFMLLRFMQLPQSTPILGLDARAPSMRTMPPEFDAPPGSILAGVWPQPVEPSIRLAEMEQAHAAVQPPPSPHPKAETAAAPANEFSERLAHAGISAEMRQLHVELAYARSEIERLRSEVGKLQSKQHVSPLYGEAMALALRGMDAAGIAGRCGISIAEAELVVALSASPGNKSSFGASHG